jgi:protein-serine/threonine kinase
MPKVPPFVAKDKLKNGNVQNGLYDWHTTSKDAILNEIKMKIEIEGKEPETKAEWYRIGKMLGKGAFGKVNLGMHKLTDSLVAIKSINKEYLEEERSRRKVSKEVAILKKINHKNIVRLYETYESTRHFLIVMELCTGGDLLNYVRKRRMLPESYAKYFFKQLVEGLIYCHKKGIVHRDIKLDNILLDHSG